MAVSPYVQEHIDLVTAIRTKKPVVEAERTAISTLTAIMARTAAYTGQLVTWDEMMKSRFQFCDYLDDLHPNSPVPVKADADGQFPVPIPGLWTEI